MGRRLVSASKEVMNGRFLLDYAVLIPNKAPDFFSLGQYFEEKSVAFA
jgi:hypothetical protein